jgi:hypothetical protein
VEDLEAEKLNFGTDGQKQSPSTKILIDFYLAKTCSKTSNFQVMGQPANTTDFRRHFPFHFRRIFNFSLAIFDISSIFQAFTAGFWCKISLH